MGVVCAAPVTGSGWQRAQVIQYDEESDTAHFRNVDNGGYDAVNSSTLRQIRSESLSLVFYVYITAFLTTSDSYESCLNHQISKYFVLFFTDRTL